MRQIQGHLKNKRYMWLYINNKSLVP